MNDITIEDAKRYFNNLTDKGKQQAFIWLMIGQPEDKQFIIDNIIFFKKSYPKMPLTKVNK